ncbi:alpha/beta fold hydrolase [Verrucomicrobia bacterium]|nr:alpha/beta fold hydrolase [Verrucomicrobiota bacterium]
MELCFQRDGSGRPLVILHGLLGSLDNWRGFQKRLREHFDVCLVDLRNHGNSPHDMLMDYDLMSADVEELLRAQQIENPIVLGHSMGGKVAMQMALRKKMELDALIVADMAPRPFDMRHQPMLDFLAQIDLGNFHDRTSVDAVLQTEIPSTVMRQFVLKNLKIREDGGLDWAPFIMGLAANYRSLNDWRGEGSWEGAVLFIKGGNSDYIREEDHPRIREHFPKSIIDTVEGAGHWLHAEKPNEFVRLVMGFLERRE